MTHWDGVTGSWNQFIKNTLWSLKNNSADLPTDCPTRELPGDSWGAYHSSELFYMFGTLDRCWRPWEERDYKLSERMVDYWCNFMKNGDPNGAGLAEWKNCESEEDVMVLE